MLVLKYYKISQNKIKLNINKSSSQSAQLYSKIIELIRLYLLLQLLEEFKNKY